MMRAHICMLQLVVIRAGHETCAHMCYKDIAEQADTTARDPTIRPAGSLRRPAGL